MNLNSVGRSKLPTFRTDLDLCTNVVVAVRKYQIMRDNGRIAEFSSFTPDHESTFQVFMTDAVYRHDGKNTGKRSMLKVRDTLRVPAMDSDCGPSHAMRESGINERTVSNLNQKISLLIEDKSVYFTKDNQTVPLKLHGAFLYNQKCVLKFSYNQSKTRRLKC